MSARLVHKQLGAGPSVGDGHKKKKPRTEASSAAELSSAQKAVKGTLKLKVAGPFSAPVGEEDVPGYSSVIQNPMDLGTIAEKLKNGGYAATGDRRVAACFFLVFPVFL